MTVFTFILWGYFSRLWPVFFYHFFLSRSPRLLQQPISVFKSFFLMYWFNIIHHHRPQGITWTYSFSKREMGFNVCVQCNVCPDTGPCFKSHLRRLGNVRLIPSREEISAEWVGIELLPRCKHWITTETNLLPLVYPASEGSNYWSNQDKWIELNWKCKGGQPLTFTLWSPACLVQVFRKEVQHSGITS